MCFISIAEWCFHAVGISYISSDVWCHQFDVESFKWPNFFKKKRYEGRCAAVSYQSCSGNVSDTALLVKALDNMTFVKTSSLMEYFFLSEPITDVWSLEGLPVILFVLLFRGQSFGDPFLLHGPTNFTFAPSLLAENLTVDNEFSGSTGFHVTVVLAKSSHESCHDNVTCLVVLVVVLYHLSRQPKYGVKFPLVLCNIFHVQ